MILRPGKIHDDVYDRSVIKRLGDVYVRSVPLLPVYEGGAAAVIALDHPENARGATIAAEATLTGPYREIGSLALVKACNALAAMAAEPENAAATVLLPIGSEEQLLRDIEDDLSRAARAMRIAMTEGYVEVTAAVTRPVLTIRVTGSRLCAMDLSRRISPVRMYIVASKWTGLAGTYLLAREQGEALQQMFAMPLLETAREMRTLLSVVPEARAIVAGQFPYAALVSCESGGIYAALWKITQQIGRGFTVSLPEIPIRQETIEICNYYDINPYTMDASGCLLCVTPEPQALVRLWNDVGIHAAVIGELSDNRDMLIVNGDETAHLNKPQGDAIERIL